MLCEHKNIMSKNCVKYCIDCGAELPFDFNQPKAEQPKEEKPKKKKGAKA